MKILLHRVIVLAILLIFLVGSGLRPVLPVIASPDAGASRTAEGTSQAQQVPLRMAARTTENGIVFALEGVAPAAAAEAILWYDTERGHQARRFKLQPNETFDRSVAISLKDEGLVVNMPFNGRLDYWWALRDADKQVIWREAGAVLLPFRLRALAEGPQPDVPRPFKWSESGSEHYRFRYYPGSPAERDIEQIKKAAEAAFDRDTEFIPATEAVSITVYLVPRVFWQGGVAYDGSTLMISYPDRNYAGVGADLYLQHETVHALAHGLVNEGSDIGGLIGEGLATYVPGGHYGPEPIDAWTAALRRNGRFVPLCKLRATFFQQQHEIAYLEGASFVGYLIRTFGLEAFRTFYAEEPAVPENANMVTELYCANEAKRVTAGTGKTYAELEAGWLAWLDQHTPTDVEQAGIEGQLRFFDLMRHYQEVRDPNARILPDPPRRWDARIQNAFASPALTETNTVYESMFVSADRALDSADPATANTLMDELDIAISTGVFTGTNGRQIAAIGSLLRRTARDARLGESSQPIALLFPTPEDDDSSMPLWTDYRLVLNSVELDGTTALVRAERQTRMYGGQERREGVMITLARGILEWRITSLTPDPGRPPVIPAAPRRDPLRIADMNEPWIGMFKAWEHNSG